MAEGDALSPYMQRLISIGNRQGQRLYFVGGASMMDLIPTHVRQHAFANQAVGARAPAEMQPAEINRELDAISKKQSKLIDTFIEQGRGHETFVETDEKAKLGDPLAQQSIALSDRKYALNHEIFRRTGDRSIHRMPKGFGPIRMLA